jgi:hypothetical protein
MQALDDRPTGDPVASRYSRPTGTWQPLAGERLLDRLRFTGRHRPEADPELPRALRAVLGDGRPGDGVVARAGAPRVVTRDVVTRLLGQGPGGAGGCATPTAPLAVGFLMKALFRQLNVLGRIDDPLADGLAALTVDGHAQLVDWITRLAPADLAELSAEVDRQASALARRWPTLSPCWLPRTRQTLRAPLAGGAVSLVAQVDLAIGRPAPDRASVGIVELRSGYRRPGHAADLHFCALVETLRTGVPPFVVATYYSRDGELDVEPVDGELLLAAARRTAAALRVLHGPADGPVPVGREVPRS